MPEKFKNRQEVLGTLFLSDEKNLKRIILYNIKMINSKIDSKD